MIKVNILTKDMSCTLKLLSR